MMEVAEASMCSTAIWSSDMCSVTVRKPSRAKVSLQIGAGEANGVPPQAAQGEGQQKERANEHALDRDLHGRERRRRAP